MSSRALISLLRAWCAVLAIVVMAIGGPAGLLLGLANAMYGSMSGAFAPAMSDARALEVLDDEQLERAPAPAGTMSTDEIVEDDHVLDCDFSHSVCVDDGEPRRRPVFTHTPEDRPGNLHAEMPKRPPDA